MKRKLFHLLLPGVLLASMTMNVCAETSYGGSDWRVTFTDEKKMESSFKTSDINDTIYGIQPGDNAIVELSLKNENETPTDWYMTNKVLYSLEDRSANSGASGGAYTYRLVYTDKDNNESVLFDSDTVGGDQNSGGREGLREATAGLEDYFYLDTLDNGDSGKITLEVALEGETQGNDYQNTLADLQMNFAVELNPNAVKEREETFNDSREIVNREQDRTRTSRAQGTSVVRTGDESNLTPFVIASSVSGVLFLLLSMYGLMEKKKEEKRRERDMRLLKRISGLFFSFCLIGSMTLPAMAAEKESYTYQVRFLAGAQGEFNPGGNLSNNGTQSPKLESSECLVFDNLKPGQRVSFNNGMITLKDSGKYYIRGIRESGKDNNTVYYTAFTVEGDKDYVIAYGILGDAVAYTINYEDEDGNRLAPSETYYGNVGDRPVVSYLYIEGYQPQAYNLIGRLSENAADNVFTFVYSRVEPGETTTTTTTTPGTTTTTTTTVDGGTVTEDGGVTGEGAAPGDAAAGGAAGGAGAGGGAADAGDGGADAGGVVAPDEEVPQGPADILPVDDEEVPLANGENIIGDGAHAPSDFAKLMAVPMSAKVGILSGVVLLAGFGIRFFVSRRRKKEGNE